MAEEGQAGPVSLQVAEGEGEELQRDFFLPAAVEGEGEELQGDLFLPAAEEGGEELQGDLFLQVAEAQPVVLKLAVMNATLDVLRGASRILRNPARPVTESARAHRYYSR